MTIIAAIAPVIVVIVQLIGSNYLNKVDLYGDYDIIPKSREVRLEVGNTGSAKATNLLLVFNSTKNIANVTSIETTQPIFIVENGKELKPYHPYIVNRKYFVLSAPRLVQGWGSYLDLKLAFNESVQTPKFLNIDVVSDQGSITALDRSKRSPFLMLTVFYQKYSSEINGLLLLWSAIVLVTYYIYRKWLTRPKWKGQNGRTAK